MGGMYRTCRAHAGQRMGSVRSRNRAKAALPLPVSPQAKQPRSSKRSKSRKLAKRLYELSEERKNMDINILLAL